MASTLLQILADFDTQLASGVSIGATTATLVTATDDDGVSLPTGTYGLTIDAGNSSKEYLVCTLTSTALTNIVSISRQGASTTGFTKAHRRGAKVTVTDWATLSRINRLLKGTDSFDANNPLSYDADPGALSGNQLATAAYVLSVASGGGSVTFDTQILSSQTSGEALTINDIVYFKESDQKWYKTDADLTTTFDQLQLGVNITTAAGSDVAIQVVLSGSITGFSSLTAGSKYYLSNTSGGISSTAGTYSNQIGWALTTTKLLFAPNIKGYVTLSQKQALVGSLGTPSSTNKYTTQDNQSTAGTDQSQTTQNATVEVGEANATTKKNKINQSFIATKTKIRGVKLYKSANTGTFTGTVTVALYADSGGSPTGSALATVTITNLEYNNTVVGEFEALFDSEYSLTVGDLYWIQISTSTSDTSNHPNLGTNSAGGYSNGSVKYWNTTDGYVAISTIDLYFKTLEGINSQSVKTDTSGKISDNFIDHSAYIPAFQQTFPIDDSDTPTAQTAMPDGSAIFISFGPNSIKRFQRDSKTGMYYLTHSINPTSHPEYLVVIGNYVYSIQISTNFLIFRYLASDLTGEASCVVPTVAASGTMMAWTDGTNLYLASNTAPTTVNIWSVSGTTFSAVSTHTTDDFYTSSGPNRYQTMYDGKNIYILYNSSDAGNTLSLYKMDDVYNTTQSSVEIGYQSNFGDGGYICFLINIDDDRLYAGIHYENYNEYGAETLQGINIVLLPFSKSIIS